MKNRIVEVTARKGGECWLIISEKNAVLFETGFDFCAREVVDNMRSALGERPLDLILLSHSHYDHICGCAKIKRAYPMAEVIAHPYVRQVLGKPGAIAVMRDLDRKMAADLGIVPDHDAIDEIVVDRTVSDGEIIRLDDMSVQVVTTPGHTKCSTSYYIPEDRLLMNAETVGVAPKFQKVIPAFIVGYQMALDSIEKSRQLGAEHMIISHYGLMPDQYVEGYFDRAREAAEHSAAFILEQYEKGLSEEETVNAYMLHVHGVKSEVQPERASLLNIQAMVPRVLEEVIGSRKNKN